jgi:predicted small secreted protein
MSDTLMRRMAFALLLAVAAGSLTACNTAEGVGEDVEATGEAIEDAAE